MLTQKQSAHTYIPIYFTDVAICIFEKIINDYEKLNEHRLYQICARWQSNKQKRKIYFILINSI